MKKIRIGVLGLANIATRSIIPTINKLPNLFNFVGVASRDYKKAKKFSEKFNCFAFSDYHDLIVNGN